MYTNVHIIFIHNSRKVQTGQITKDGEWIQSTVYTYNGIYSAIKRNEQFLNMHNTSQKHYAK